MRGSHGISDLPHENHVAGEKVDEICRRHGISSAAFYTWRKKFGGMEASDAKGLREIVAENAKLKRLAATIADIAADAAMATEDDLASGAPGADRAAMLHETQGVRLSQS